MPVPSTIPLDREIMDAVLTARVRLPGTYSKAIWGEVKSANPSWSLSLKRLKEVANRPIFPSCVVVRETASTTDYKPPTKYSMVLSQMEGHCLSTPSSGGDDLTEIAAMLGVVTVQEQGRFFDRDPKITEWYYQVYGTGEGQPNHTLRFMWNRERQCPRGDVIIVKNGPLGCAWETDGAITAVDVARTVWWYWASGRDSQEVAREREMEHFITNYL